MESGQVNKNWEPGPGVGVRAGGREIQTPAEKTLLILSVFTWFLYFVPLTLSWRRPLSYRNQPIDLRDKLLDWFLYDNGLRHERVHYNQLCSWWKLLETTSHFLLTQTYKRLAHLQNTGILILECHQTPTPELLNSLYTGTTISLH